MRKKSLGIVLSTLALIAALLLSLAGCGEDPAPKPDDPTPTPTPAESGAEAGVYYFDAGDAGEYLLTLGGKCHYTLAIGTAAEDGDYTLADGTLTLTSGSLTRTAKLERDVVTLTYENAQMRFLKKAYYTVTYSTDGGSATAPSTVLNGKTLPTPADPTKDGYAFLGWYADAAFTTPFAFGSTPVTGDVTLYARFVPRSADAKEYTVHYDLGYAGTSLSDARTIGGKLYDVATPTREGYTFVGWWLSDTADGKKLTARFVGAESKDATVFTEDTTLYAVWQKADATTATPAVSVTDKAASWDSVGATAYLVTVTAPDGTVVVNAQRVTGTTFPLTLPEAGEYKIEVVAVNAGGSAVSEVATRYYTHLALDRVGDFFVTDSSVLVFRGADGAEHYYITVDCGNGEHLHAAFDNGTSTCFNFSGCEMKKGGITFTVTATATGRASSTATYTYEKHLDSVEGLNAADGVLSWNAVSGATYYIVKIGNATVKVADTRLSLLALANGEYTATVTPVTRGYNSPDAAVLTFTKATPALPQHLRLVGTVLSWDAVPGATSYEVRFGDVTLTVAEGATSVDLADADVAFAEGSDYTVTLKVVGANASAEKSVTVRYHEMKADLEYKAGKLTWTPVLGADLYEVQVENGEILTVTGDSFCKFDTLAKAGENTLRVRFKSGTFTSEWTEISVTAYAVTLDSRGGTATSALYKAVGDPMTLPAPGKDGYVFVAWYNVPGGAESNGRRYVDPYFAESGEIVLYAYYTPKTYTLSLSAGDDENKTASVRYGKNYTLPVPVTSSATASFGGWYSAPNGSGIAYTDTEGNSLAPWGYLDDNVTLYAFWVDNVLSFEKVGSGYAVSAGSRIDLVTTVTIPAEYRGAKVTVIAGGAFLKCTTMTELRIPNSIVEIATGAFEGCENLASVEVYDAKETSPRYSSSDGVLFDRGTSDARHALRPVYMPAAKSGAYTVPAGVDVIPARAFAESKLTKIVLPTSVREIGTEAFAECELLTSVVFENAGATSGVPALTVGDRAFYKCEELTSIVLPARLGSISLLRYELSDGEFSEENTPNAFEEGSLEEITVAKGHNAKYTSVDGVLFGDYGTTLVYFPRYKEIKDYTIPAGVTKIADGAFYGCRHLEGTLTIPARISAIGEAAFRGATGLSTLTFAGATVPAGLSIGDYAFDGHRITTLTFAEGSLVQSIGAYAFRFDKDFYSGQREKKDVTIPASVTSVGDGAFANYGTLSVTIASGESAVAFGNGVFEACEIGTLTLPKNLTALPNFFAGITVTSIEVDPENETFLSVDDVLYTKNAEGNPDTLLLYPMGKADTSFVIPDTVTAIADYAFAGATFSSLTIPASVKTIGDYAFYYTSRLASLTIPSSVASIGEYAFLSSGVKTVTYEEGDTPLTIGDYAFYQTKLTAIHLPERVRTIGAYAFNKTKQVTTLSLGGVETIGAYAFDTCKASGEVILPATLKSIGEYAFNNAYQVTAFTFAEGATLETIGEYAFSQCKFTTFTVPASVRLVADYAFASCSSLTELLFEDGAVDLVFGVNATGSYSILYGTKVASLTFPSRLVRIGNGACQCAYQLQSVTFGENSRLTTIGDEAFLSATKLTTVTIPASVKNTDVIGIGHKAFYDSALTTVLFESGTEPLTIGESAFYAALVSITLPARLASFTDADGNVTLPLANGRKVFGEYNSTLKTLFVEEGCRIYAAQDGVLYNADMTELLFCLRAKEGDVVLPATLKKISSYAFDSCRQVTSVDFTTCVALEEIGEYAFKWCDKLTSITLPDSVTKIEKFAFAQCQNVTDIKLPAKITEFDKDMFDGCLSLTNLTMGEGGNHKMTDGVLFTADGKTLVYCTRAFANADYTVPDGVERIAEEAFKGNYTLTSLTLPASLTRVDSTAFNGCKNLSSVTFTSGKAPLVIGYNSFANTGLASITIPARTISIDDDAFSGNGTLTSVTFEADSKLVYVGERAFANTNLASIALPTSVREIGEYAFFACYGLTSVTLPDGVNKVGESVFRACGKLETVTLPASLTELGNYAFRECGSLRTVNFAKGIGLSTLYVGTFTGCKALESIEIPASLLEIPDRDNSIEGYDGNAGLFADCTSLRRVTFEEGSKCVRIGNYAFARTAIETLTIPASVSAIGEYAFYESALSTVTIPNTVTSLGISAFEACDDLSTVTLGSGVRELPSGLFGNCPSLRELLLPAAVVQVDSGAFYNSENLKISLAEDSTMNLLKGVLYDAKWNICVFPETITKYEIPKDMTAFPEDFFDSSDGTAKQLEKITVAAGNTHFVEENGLLYTADKSALLFAGVTSFEIDEDAILAAGGISGLIDILEMSRLLESITVADGIGEAYGISVVGGVLYDDEWNILVFPQALTTYTIPAALEEIPSCMFSDNTRLTDVFAEARGEDDPALTVGYNAFYGATALKSVTFPANLEGINDDAFEGCTALRSVTFSTIDEYADWEYDILGAFSECEALEEINIEETEDYKSIDGVMFWNDSDMEAWSAFFWPVAKTVFTIPADLEVLPSLWYEESPLVTVTYERDAEGNEVAGAELLEIDFDAFADIESLETVELPSRLTAIYDGAFANCTGISEIRIPETIEFVGAGVFEGWTAEQTIYVDWTEADVATEMEKLDEEGTPLGAFDPAWLDGCDATVVYKAEE